VLAWVVWLRLRLGMGLRLRLLVRLHSVDVAGANWVGWKVLGVVVFIDF